MFLSLGDSRLTYHAVVDIKRRPAFSDHLSSGIKIGYYSQAPLDACLHEPSNCCLCWKPTSRLQGDSTSPLAGVYLRHIWEEVTKDSIVLSHAIT